MRSSFVAPDVFTGRRTIAHAPSMVALIAMLGNGELEAEVAELLTQAAESNTTLTWACTTTTAHRHVGAWDKRRP
jgi:hypothetical protein